MPPQNCHGGAASDFRLYQESDLSPKGHPDRKGNVDIVRACEKNNLLWLTNLLKGVSRSDSPSGLGVTDADGCDEDGWTGLHWASFHNNHNMMSSLQEVGVNVNLKAHTGDTALSIAVMYGHESCGLKLIQSNKCSLNSLNKSGFTPLMYACRFNHISLAKALIGGGASVSIRNPVTGEDCLTLACRNGHHEIVKILVNAGAVKYENSDEFRRAVKSAKDDDIKSLLINESRWYLRKPFLMTLTQGDIIESSLSRCKHESYCPAEFKAPSLQEKVFFNLYREISFYL